MAREACRRRAFLCALAALFFASVPLCGQSALTAEQVEAGFIYNFTKYTEWPTVAGRDDSRFHLCVAGDGGVVEQLDRAVNGKAVGNRSIVVRHLEEHASDPRPSSPGVADSAGVGDCEILYVGRISRQMEERLVSLLPGQVILTIGSTPGFLRGAGMITFVFEDNRVRFDINARLAEKVNIRFDSRILALARNKNEVSR